MKRSANWAKGANRTNTFWNKPSKPLKTGRSHGPKMSLAKYLETNAVWGRKV